MIRWLVPRMSYISVEPFWCNCRIGSYMIRNKHWIPFWEWRRLDSYQAAQSRTRGHSDMTIGLVPTRWDIRAISILEMELPSEVPGILGLGLRDILIWLWDVFSHYQIWVHGHSDVIEGCVPTWSDIRADSIFWENGGTCSVTRNP